MGSLLLASWRRELRARGRVRWTPPEGAEMGEVIVEERARPVVSLRELLVRRGATTARTGAVERRVTREGELGAIVEYEAGGVWGALGVVVGDDFLTVVDGRTAHACQRARVRAATEEVVVHLPLSLGTKRPRRFFFRPPPGWYGVARGLGSTWLAPGYPRDPTTITVLPARRLDASFSLEAMFHDEAVAEVALADVTHATLDLRSFTGTVARASVGEQAFVTIALDDLHYVYVLRLATEVARVTDGERALIDLAETCVPLPVSARAR